MKKEKIILSQTDRKIRLLAKSQGVVVPASGWIYAIRQSLGMSLRQLGNRMGITPQSVREMEEREKSGTISLNVLREFANSMDMKFVYGFIPKKKSLEKLLDDRVKKLAEDIVKRTSVSMELEDQKLEPWLIREIIKQKAIEIKYKMPRYLWD